MRARPPQVIRNSIAELANYDANVKASLAQNADAARAYFPVLQSSAKPVPFQLTPSESRQVQLNNAVVATIAESPLAIQPPTAASQSKLHTEMRTIQSFYGTASAARHKAQTCPSMWDPELCFVIPDVLPAELLPPSLRFTSHRRKRRKVLPEIAPEQESSERMFDKLRSEEGAQNADVLNTKQPEDDDDEQEPNQADQGDDDEDIDQIADYQTGMHFDDDDGYEEVESGDDAEPVVAF